jgi:hypothetical protein
VVLLISQLVALLISQLVVHLRECNAALHSAVLMASLLPL